MGRIAGARKIGRFWRFPATATDNVLRDVVRNIDAAHAEPRELLGNVPATANALATALRVARDVVEDAPEDSEQACAALDRLDEPIRQFRLAYRDVAHSIAQRPKWGISGRSRA
jgi:hypothetical protein